MRKFRYLLLIIFISFLFLDLEGLEKVSIKSISSDSLTGKIEKIEGESLVLASGSEKKTFKLKNLENISFIKNEDADEAGVQYPEFEVRLVTGDVLMGKIVRATDDDRGFLFTSISFGNVPILLRWVDYIKNLANAEGGFTIDVNANKEEFDVLYFSKTSQSNDSEKNADNLIGTVNAITFNGVDFTDKFGYFEDYLFEWEKITAITFYHDTKPEMPKKFQVIASTWSGENFVGFIGDSDGSTFSFQSPVLTVPNYTEDDEDVWKEHEKGLKVKVSDKMLSKLTFRFGNFSYLSDFTPSKVEEYPYFGGKNVVTDADKYWWKYKMDRSVTNKDLYLKNAESKNVKYVKGIGVHSYSKLTFNLNKEYKHFMTDIGIEADAGKQASVIFKVFLDDAEKPAFESSIKLENSGIESIKVDVANVEKLHLVVDFANNGDIQDRAIWGNARVIKE